MNVKKYYSGEEIKIGDHITTDSGEDHNTIMKFIDNDKDRDDYGVDCFGALMSSSQAGGIIFVPFDEISSQDTKLIHRIMKSDKIIDI